MVALALLLNVIRATGGRPYTKRFKERGERAGKERLAAKFT
jgi:hypothetical protein